MNAIQQVRTLALALKDGYSVGAKARHHAKQILFAIEWNDGPLMREHVLSLSECKGEVVERLSNQILRAMPSDEVEA